MVDAQGNATQATAPNTAGGQPMSDHDRSDIALLYKIYVDKRLQSQADFYRSRVRENQSNANFTFLVSTAVMSISALVAAVSAVVSSPFFSLLSAILPALAALLAAFRQLYGWERQSSIYQDALMGLERVKLLTPDKDEMPVADLATIYPQIVSGVEEVFTGEVNQWGQFVQNADKNAPDDSADSRVTNALMSDLRLSDEQIDTIRKIVAAGAPKAAFSEQHTITVHPEETSALPSGATVATPAATQSNQAAATPAPITDTAPITVTTTRTDTTTIQPQETTNMFPTDEHTASEAAASAPLSVTTSRVESTVIEQHIPALEPTPAVETVSDSAATADNEPPAQEGENALTPGAMHVDAPQASEETDALTNHYEFANEPPPPEALSSLAPGAMHVDTPQAPPDNPNPDADPNANG